MIPLNHVLIYGTKMHFRTQELGKKTECFKLKSSRSRKVFHPFWKLQYFWVASSFCGRWPFWAATPSLQPWGAVGKWQVLVVSATLATDSKNCWVSHWKRVKLLGSTHTFLQVANLGCHQITNKHLSDTQHQSPAMLCKISNKGLNDVKLRFVCLRATLSYFCLWHKLSWKYRALHITGDMRLLFMTSLPLLFFCGQVRCCQATTVIDLIWSRH